MGQANECCQHPGDLEACLASLAQAYSTGTLESHCILVGLAKEIRQCRQVLAAGLLGQSAGSAARRRVPRK